MISRPLYIAVRIVIPLMILAAGFVGFRVLVGLRPAPEQVDRKPPLPLVEVVTVQPHDGDLTFEVDGSVVPLREVTLSAQVSGNIIEKASNSRPGMTVQRGDVLFRIDAQDYELEIERLESSRAQAEASIGELEVQIVSATSLAEITRAEHALKTRDLQRARDLLAKNAASQSDVDLVEQAEQAARRAFTQQDNERRLAITQRTRLQRGLELVESQLRKARLDLERTSIVAPLNGVVVSDPGEHAGFVQRGTELVTIEDVTAVDVRCALKMDELYWLWQHRPLEWPSAENDSRAEPQPVTLPPAAAPGLAGPPLLPGNLPASNDGAAPDALSEVPEVPVSVVYRLAGHEFLWTGHLSRIDGAGLDPRTRTVACVVRVDDPRAISVRSAGSNPQPAARPPRLMRGMFVSVELHSRPAMPLLSVPENAVRPGGMLWRVNDDDRLERLKVDVIRIVDGRAIIAGIGPIAAGERIVTSPLTTETSGTRVRTTQPGAAGIGEPDDLSRRLDPFADDPANPAATFQPAQPGRAGDLPAGGGAPAAREVSP